MPRYSERTATIAPTASSTSAGAIDSRRDPASVEWGASPGARSSDLPRSRQSLHGRGRKRSPASRCRRSCTGLHFRSGIVTRYSFHIAEGENEPGPEYYCPEDAESEDEDFVRPSEDSPFEIAGLWSINPLEIESREERGVGLVGTMR